uniref:Uncharacterized protein ycf35 n=1 Tax=Melanothamnus harveyi TaxID=397005 RepID=A0A1Z1MH63_MELHR|nr:hypothetical protein [Melanothamnus harveyi]ARW65410.1 hypothetical protein [Melanothamnus harveyi]
MSHFSKIKTSITDLGVLKKTIDDLGFFYKVSSENLSSSTVFVYDSDLYVNQVPSCSFEWNINQYLLVVDLGLWNLDIDFNYFTERLLQQYAYNVVIKQGNMQGFTPVVQKLTDNGSINLILQRF